MLVVALAFAAGASARGTYQEPGRFVADAFGGSAPAPRELWIHRALRAQIREVLGHDLGVARLRYWGGGGRTVWILEEIGKEQPITTGVVIQAGRIEQMKVLVYREIRGGEVRHPFFIDQFKGAALGPAFALDRTVDGISGATLSVRALDKLARLALLLDTHAGDGDGVQHLSRAD
ncbi:MAG: FMN-binding protein [Gammaproteobacteria bacterium]|nr:FMN-binding protein [Gammaproteobacteria bacterium]